MDAQPVVPTPKDLPGMPDGAAGAQADLLPPVGTGTEAVGPERVIRLCNCRFNGKNKLMPRIPSGNCEIHND
jgi:hypothetical protein